MTSHVFISYSRKDTGFAEKIERDLNARRVVTWRDANSIVGSEDWYNSIIDGIENAYAVILVVTVNADQSVWVKREALYADRLGVPIIPVKPEPDTARLKLDFLLGEKQPVECDEPHYTSGLAQITAKLGELAEAYSPPARTTSRPRPDTTAADRRAEMDYLDFLLSEAEADLRTKLYVSLLAMPERAARKMHSLGLPGQRRPSLGRLGIQYVEGEDCDQPGDTVDDARQPLREMQRVLLLGEPGSGKTTTLLQLAIDLAQEAREALQHDADSLPKLPVFLSLSSYTGQQPFDTFVRGHLGPLQSRYDRLRDTGRLVLLCDALNEMPRPATNGRSPARDVRGYLRDRQPWIVSCRVRDYQEELKDLPDVGRVRLKPLDLPRIQQVIERRFGEQPDQTAALWEDLKGSERLLAAWQVFVKVNQAEAFWSSNWPDAAGKWHDSKNYPLYQAWQAMHRDNRRMMLLCRNPYMLFLVCEIFDATGSLPENRGALFAAFVDDLLDREQDTSQRTGRDWIDAAIIRQALAQLAYAMQRSETGTEITRAEAERVLDNLPDVTDPALLLRLAAAASLLDVGDRVRYTHQLLQEYFASEVMGAAMDAGRNPTEFWPAANWWEAQGWEETAIILAGVRGDPQAVARWIAPAQPEVAYQALTECGVAVDLDTVQPETRAALVDNAHAKTGEANPVGRAAAYRVLGVFDADARSGIGLGPDGLPDIDWVEIPAGPFLMGSTPEQVEALKKEYNWDWPENEKPQHTVELPTYYISRYPITYRQFQVFIDAPDGFHNPVWWDGLLADDEHKQAPGEQYRKYWNHPRENVSWYDAMAFCRWLSAKLGVEVRLPTEAEWEKAARGPDGRIYPYGNEFDLAKGNTSETGIGQTSAVGLLPDGESPYGVLDMSGNVWQWCLTEWRENYADSENNDPAGDARRVVRGGSCFNNRGGSRCAYRPYGLPSSRLRYDGFRVVVLRPPSL